MKFYDCAQFGFVCLKGNEVTRGEAESYVFLQVLVYWWPFWKMTSFCLSSYEIFGTMEFFTLLLPGKLVKN